MGVGKTNMDKKELKIWNDGFNRGINIFAVNLKKQVEQDDYYFRNKKLKDYFNKVIDNLEKSLKG